MAQDVDNDHDTVLQAFVERSAGDPLRARFDGLKGRTVCILGGCGQVGSHLATKLYELGWPPENLWINDNLSLGRRENLPPPLRDRVDPRPHLEFAQNPGLDADVVVFVGGRSSAPHFKTFADVLDEVSAWRAVVEWCTAAGSRLLLASTSSLCKTRPSVETQPVWAGSYYELTKLMMEEMAITAALLHGLNVRVARLFSVYGVAEQHKGSFGNLYTQLLRHARSGERFELWGQAGRFKPGEQTRDTIFAADVARALLFLLALPAPRPTLGDVSDLVYNVGQGRPVTVLEMIDRVAARVGRRPVIDEAEVPRGVKNYVVHTWGDPAKLLGAGFIPLFADHVENLSLIDVAMSDMDAYWHAVDRIRERTLATDQPPS